MMKYKSVKARFAINFAVVNRFVTPSEPGLPPSIRWANIKEGGGKQKNGSPGI